MANGTTAKLSHRLRTENATATSDWTPTVNVELGWRSFLYHWPILPGLALALLLGLASAPAVFLLGDDAEYAIVADSLSTDWRSLSNANIEDLGPTAFVREAPLMLYLVALARLAVGSAEAAVVFVSMAISLSTVAAVYALGAKLRSRTAGGYAAALLAIMPLHLILGRRAFFEAGVTLFLALSVLCAIFWLERRNTRWAVLTGLAASAAVLSNYSGLLVLVPLLVALAAAFATTRRAPKAEETPEERRARKAARRALGHQAGFMAIPIAAGLLAWLALLWHLQATKDWAAHLGWFGYQAPPSGVPARPWHWYLTDGSLGLYAHLGLFLAMLCLIGLGFVVFRPRHRPISVAGLLVLLSWPLAILAFFSMRTEKEWFYVVPLAPALAVLAAEPMARMTEKFRAVLSQDNRRSPFQATTMAVAGTLLVAAVIGYAPTSRSYTQTVEGASWYGAGVREAAAFIHDSDPEAGQIGTTIARYSLHLYNGQTTYHWYVDHDFVEQQIQAGAVRYLVIDSYLPLDHETVWFDEIKDKYGSEAIAKFPEVGPRVWVYELYPTPV